MIYDLGMLQLLGALCVVDTGQGAMDRCGKVGGFHFARPGVFFYFVFHLLVISPWA